MDDRALGRMCRTWQRRLRLMDWRIAVRYLPAAEMGEDLGRCEYDDTEMEATISIVADGEHPGHSERTLVHELLHLRLAAWSAPHGDPAQETAINLLADSILAAYRRRRKGASADSGGGAAGG